MNDDTRRLAWLLEQSLLPECFVHVALDRYEYAAQVAQEAGRDEPNESDYIEGFRRLIDAAMATTNSSVTDPTDDCCEFCNDGDGNCAYPYYGVAPHTHAPGPIIGSTRLFPKSEWGNNFREDPDGSGCGIYMRCQHCGRGEKA